LAFAAACLLKTQPHVRAEAFVAGLSLTPQLHIALSDVTTQTTFAFAFARAFDSRQRKCKHFRHSKGPSSHPRLRRRRGGSFLDNRDHHQHL